MKSFLAFMLFMQVAWSRNLSMELLKIQFEDCGSQFVLKELSLSTCYSIPCDVEKGNFVTFTAEFDASSSPYSAYSLQHEAYWIVDGITQSAILLPNSCDKTSGCPKVTSSGLLEFSSEVYVSSSLPKLQGILHFKSKNAYGDVLMCYKVPVSIH